ncbi:zinc finger protein 57 homolog [Odontomachus brunneus]|uniref:zinc finger protein 57 homolog n=1 Tax=Odontomachus brunneus TaxID=486640 RepID=UPI0013F22788|nr:zinc finger protein 57 homolog [Odontomachus brunneus]
MKNRYHGRDNRELDHFQCKEEIIYGEYKTEPRHDENSAEPNNSANDLEVRHEDIAKPSSANLYHCSTCGKPYRTRASLNYHRRVECKKEPRFACTFCTYKSTRSSNLRRHMLLHCHVMEPHVCE